MAIEDKPSAKKQRGKVDTFTEIASNSMQFSDTELKVLQHFRKYLMTPGDMLCLSGQELDSMGNGVDSLMKRQMLVAEKKAGCFCLTQAGFDAMREVAE